MEEEESPSLAEEEEEEDPPTTLPLYKRGGPDGLSIMDQVTPRYYGSSPNKEPAPRYYRNTEKEEQLFKCAECDKLFTRKSNLKIHMKVHYDGAKITCEVCQQQFLDKSNFNRHMNTKHHKDKTAIRKRRKVSPLKVRVPVSPEKKEDSNTESSPNKLTIKLEEEGREDEEYSEEECTGSGRSDRMTCKVCLRQFMDKESLESHEQKYGGKKNYKCSTCEKCFHYRTSWIRHEECHKTERKVWPCDTCDMTFTQKVNLKRHKEGNKNPCNGEFREGGLYKNPKNGEFRVWTEGQHRSTEGGTELRKKDCNNRTQRRQSSQAVNESLRLDHVYSNLRDNESEDEDDDLLDDEVEDDKQSDNAEDNTTNNTSINNDHIQKGVSLYACNYCGKVFHYRSLWTRHEKEHLSSHKSFQCHICGTKFTRQFYLSKHRKVCFRSRLGNS